MILFLDFDGVLHVRGRLPLEYAEQLAKLLAELSPVSIVLSTSWVEAYGLDEVIAMLPESLQPLVIGATCVDGEPPAETRYADIAACAARAGLRNWIALDDDAEGWPDEERHRLIHCDPQLGLATPGVIEALTEKLHETTRPRPAQP